MGVYLHKSNGEEIYYNVGDAIYPPTRITFLASDEKITEGVNIKFSSYSDGVLGGEHPTEETLVLPEVSSFGGRYYYSLPPHMIERIGISENFTPPNPVGHDYV